VTAPAFDDVGSYQLEGYRLEGHSPPAPPEVPPSRRRVRRADRRLDPSGTPTRHPDGRRRLRLRLRRKASADARARAEDRPYARLGLLWAVLLLAAVVIGSVALALLVAPVGLIAAASALRAARQEPAADTEGPSAPETLFFGRPIAHSDVRRLVLGCVVLTPFVALAGPIAALAGSALVVGVAAVAAPSLGCSRLGGALAVAAPVSAMSAVVAARGQGSAVGFVLVTAIIFYDAAACLMGNRPTGGIVGVVSALLSLAALGFLVALLANPPFGGDRAWVFCLMVGVLAWVGVKLSRALMRGGPTLPALARLDSLVVAGPVWVIAVAFVLHR
jgi:hypothetical protein